MNIAGREIEGNNPPYCVAEISGNHCGKLETALKLIKAAKDCGADAVKFQCYTPDELTLNSDKEDFIIKEGLWKGRKLYDLYESAYTPREWFGWIFEQGKRSGITVFSSVFSKEGVDFLEEMGCPAYKIASMEITDIPLIQYAASKGKPIIFSTGMASFEEKVEACRVAGDCLPLACISGYPTPIAEVRLGMGWSIFPKIGISDHTKGIEIPIAATVLGACLIEKHFTLDRSNGSEDAEFSLEPHEFKQMVKSVKNVWQAMQPSESKSEEASRQLRRSLYVVEDVKNGEVFTEKNVRSIRPSYGMPPKELPSILENCCATMDIPAGTALKEEMIQAWARAI